MKKILRFSLLSLLALSILAVTGCKKDEEGPDRNALLTAHVWKFSTLTTTSTNQDVQLLVSFMSAFLATFNATLTYSTDGTYALAAQDSSDSGTWELSADGSTIIVNKGTDDESIHTIKTLTADVLEFDETVVDDDYGTFVVTYKWVK
jgi:hypothetical protein